MLHLIPPIRKVSRYSGIVLCILLVLTAVPGFYSEPFRKTASAAEDITPLPLSFVPNAGQTNPMVRFMVHSPAGRLFFTPTTVVLALTAPRLPDPPDPANPFAIPERPDPPSTLRMRFLGARPETTLTGIRQLEGTANYLIGEDPEQWRSRLPTFAAIVYQSLYDGIDLRYEGGEGRLKSSYLVAARADPSRIRWRYEGATHVQIDPATGDLVITVPIAPQAGGGQHILREHAPVAWQVINGQQILVTAGYAMAQNGSIGFDLGAFDASQPLIIDPTLAYSTYLGGSSVDWGQDIAMDNAGHVFVTGWTYSTDFPTEVPWQPGLIGSYDVYVTKLSIDGSALEFSTYLGGEAYDGGYGIALDRAGNAVVTGKTLSTDFPLAYAPFQPQLAGSSDVFVARLSSDGTSLLHGTFLGGSSYDQGSDVAVDQGQSGSVYVTGSTKSSNFPTANPWDGSRNGTDDAFVARLSANLDGLTYSTYLGGNSVDWGYGIAADDDGAAYVVGTTQSNSFLPSPLYAFQGGPDDGFVIKLSDAGSPVFSTYLGGAAHDSGSGIAVDSSHAAYVVGETSSSNFPVVNALQTANAGAVDVFASKLNPAGTGLMFSTYLGGSSYDNGFGIALDFASNVYLTGRTYSYNFPLVDAMQSTIAGEDDAFVAKLTSNGSVLTYSTFLGGSNRDLPYGVAVDNVCNAAITGFTLSEDYPTSANALQPKLGGSYDAFISKIGGDVEIWVDTTAISVTLQPGESITVPITIGNDGDDTLCYSITKEEVSYPTQNASIEFPPYKVDPALEEVLEKAPNGMADFLVYLTTQADLSAAYQIEDWSERGWYVYDTLRDTAADTQEGVLATLADLLEVGHVTAYEPHFIVNAVSATGDSDAVDSLAERSDVVYLEASLDYRPDPFPDPLMEPSASITRTWNGVPGGLEEIGADRVWSEFGYMGNGVVVANIDSGVAYTHTALVQQYRGHNPVTGEFNHDFNWYDPFDEYPNSPGHDVDDGHGTHTIGTMIGHDPSGAYYGFDPYAGQSISYTGTITAGVAPGAAWIAARGWGNDNVSQSALLSAVEWMIAPCPIGVDPDPTDQNSLCNPDKRPHVVNNSWSTEIVHVGALRASGILPAVSAGNSGGHPSVFCNLSRGAANPGSFSSGASFEGSLRPWSSRGPGSQEQSPDPPLIQTNEFKPNVVAPGSQVISTVPYGDSGDCGSGDPDPRACIDGYGRWNGTSMAIPHVAGSAAVLMEALVDTEQSSMASFDPSTISRVECLLTNTAIDVVDAGGLPTGGWLGPDFASGFGQIDLYEAVTKVVNRDLPLWLMLASAIPNSPTTISGVVPPNQAITEIVIISAICPDSGTYLAHLTVISNDADDSEVILPVELSVQDNPLPTCPPVPIP